MAKDVLTKGEAGAAPTTELADLPEVNQVIAGSPAPMSKAETAVFDARVAKEREAQVQKIREKGGMADLPGGAVAVIVGADVASTPDVTEEVTVDYKHRVKAIRRLDVDRVIAGEGPLVDGARYNVVVKTFESGEVRPLYVTDAMTGERLPTMCSFLVQEGEQWFGQMQSRMAGGEVQHDGLDPVHLVHI